MENSVVYPNVMFPAALYAYSTLIKNDDEV
jgi:hypothetical protein